MEPQENADVFGAVDGQAAADRAAALGRFALSLCCFVGGLVLLGFGMSHQDTGGALWFVGGIIAVTTAFALPLGLRDR